MEIEKLVYGGSGLAHLNREVLLTPYVLPGEQVEIENPRTGGKVTRARMAQLLRRSEERIKPHCPLFERCGGCHYQHIPYSKQLDYKVAILRETLSRVGKIAWEVPIQTVSAEPWGYRNRTQLHITKGGKRRTAGFLEAGSHRLVEAESCPINSPALNRAQQALSNMLGDRRFPPFVREIEYFTNEEDVLVSTPDTGRPLRPSFWDLCRERIEGFAPEGAIDYPSGGYVYQVPAHSFFQVNRFLIDRLTQLAVGDAGGSVALDLYAGVGLFSLPLAERFRTVIAADSSGRAVRSLQFNAQRAGKDVRVVHLNVERFLPSVKDPVDLAVADPPRAGLGPQVTSELLRIKPGTLMLVSCDPATLARDLHALTSGGFQIGQVTLIDLFPQTFHIETVVRLKTG